ncbi:MAG TPA: type II toxin-antitoxin system RelE/ParE family toxin [Azonexus sp.]|jgi:toxin ParE1/3/4|nr:type II toxin-antitoxin system RelE/ParE family toxin [Azonexus sp.]
MKIVVLASAERDLAEATTYYLEHATAGIARAFLDEFRHATGLLAGYPEIGAPVSGEQRMTHFRRFPYSIIYRLRPDSVVIRAIAHHRRKPKVRQAGQ